MLLDLEYALLSRTQTTKFAKVQNKGTIEQRNCNRFSIKTFAVKHPESYYSFLTEEEISSRLEFAFHQPIGKLE